MGYHLSIALFLLRERGSGRKDWMVGGSGSSSLFGKGERFRRIVSWARKKVKPVFQMSVYASAGYNQP